MPTMGISELIIVVVMGALCIGPVVLAILLAYWYLRKRDTDGPRLTCEQCGYANAAIRTSCKRCKLPLHRSA